MRAAVTIVLWVKSPITSASTTPPSPEWSYLVYLRNEVRSKPDGDSMMKWWMRWIWEMDLTWYRSKMSYKYGVLCFFHFFHFFISSFLHYFITFLFRLAVNPSGCSKSGFVIYCLITSQPMPLSPFISSPHKPIAWTIQQRYHSSASSSPTSLTSSRPLYGTRSAFPPHRTNGTWKRSCGSTWFARPWIPESGVPFRGSRPFRWKMEGSKGGCGLQKSRCRRRRKMIFSRPW